MWSAALGRFYTLDLQYPEARGVEMRFSGRGSGLLGSHFGTVLGHAWRSTTPQSRGASPPDPPGNVCHGFTVDFFDFRFFVGFRKRSENGPETVRVGPLLQGGQGPTQVPSRT